MIHLSFYLLTYLLLIGQKQTLLNFLLLFPVLEFIVINWHFLRQLQDQSPFCLDLL